MCSRLTCAKTLFICFHKLPFCCRPQWYFVFPEIRIRSSMFLWYILLPEEFLTFLIMQVCIRHWVLSTLVCLKKIYFALILGWLFLLAVENLSCFDFPRLWEKICCSFSSLFLCFQCLFFFASSRFFLCHWFQ